MQGHAQENSFVFQMMISSAIRESVHSPFICQRGCFFLTCWLVATKSLVAVPSI
ncbi:hypothetical protein ACRAWF_24240 [Streptomyces sp. L7]